jgi:hypothetical protein
LTVVKGEERLLGKSEDMMRAAAAACCCCLDEEEPEIIEEDEFEGDGEGDVDDLGEEDDRKEAEPLPLFAEGVVMGNDATTVAADVVVGNVLTDKLLLLFAPFKLIQAPDDDAEDEDDDEEDNKV